MVEVEASPSLPNGLTQRLSSSGNNSLSTNSVDRSSLSFDPSEFPAPSTTQSLPQLVRTSLKRSLDMFIGNVGLRPAEIQEATELRKRMKLFEEYGTVAEPEDVAQCSKYLASFSEASLSPPPLPSSSSSTALSLIPSPSSRPAPSSQLSLPLPNVSSNKVNPPSSTTVSLMNIPKAKGSDALSHLCFRHASRLPKQTPHPDWKLMRVISGHQGWVRCLAVDPSNEWFVSGGSDRLVKIWDLASGTLKLSLTGHINTVRAVAVSNRHPYLFSCGEDHLVKCWDLEANKVIRHYHGHLSGVYAMTLHPSIDVLATGGRDAVVRVWDMRTKAAVHILSGHSGTIMSLQSQISSPQIISGSMDKMIRCWDLTAGKCSVVLTHHKKAIRSLAIHPREYTFCSAAADHVKIWRCPEGKFERNLDTVKSIMNTITIKDDPDSAVCIGGSDQGHLHFWDWNSGKRFQTIETIPQPGSLSSERAFYDIKLDMSETRLLTAECDKTIKVWREEDT